MVSLPGVSPLRRALLILMMNNNVLRTTTLAKGEGKHRELIVLMIVDLGGGLVSVDFIQGKEQHVLAGRGSKQTKTDMPVVLDTGEKVFDHFINAHTKKGFAIETPGVSPQLTEQ